MRTDLYQGHDYYRMDNMLTEEHKLIRETARAWVKKEVSPIIEEAAEKCIFPKHLLPGLGEIGAFGPYIPEEYGGPGLDQISYGLIMQELERCDSGLRSTASVQSSLVMYPIWRYGSEEQKQKFLLSEESFLCPLPSSPKGPCLKSWPSRTSPRGRLILGRLSWLSS